MDLLIKNVTIIDPNSETDQTQGDLLIRDGLIERIDTGIEAEGVKMLDAGEAYVSPGWLDIGVYTGDPGYEQREDLETVRDAAAAGGFTSIACQPNTNPVMHTKSEILYVKNSTRGGLVDCYPIGAVSENCAGKDITEMIDMHAAGAVAFSDGRYPLQDSGLMLRALQYVTTFDGVVINQPLDYHIAGEGQIHEGIMSTSLGMKGIPAIAEELMTQRDLELLAYTGSRLHLANLSSAGAVQRLREAKARGLPVTGSVAVLNLAYSDEDLRDFDTNLKVLPPLRHAEDRAALWEGLKDGTIDIISSNHTPLEEERKKLEFPFAGFGAVMLETTYGLLQTTLGAELPVETLVQCLALRPRQLFGLPAPRLEAGQPANITVFHPHKRWTPHLQDIRSRSRNTPLLGRELTGAVLAVVNNNQSAIFEYP